MAYQNINQYVYKKWYLTPFLEVTDLSLASDERDYNEEVIFSFPSNNIFREISIYNSLGQEIHKCNTINQLQLISLQSFENGMYFYKIALNVELL